MESVIVKGPAGRTVYIDGSDNGVTDEILSVEEGRHTFDLGEPRDYEPPERTVSVTGTNPIAPLTIEFAPRPDTAT